MFEPISMDLQLFADGEDVAQDAPDGADNQPDAQTVTTDTQDAPDGLTMTQAELDAKITTAKGQADRTALNRYLKGFGLTKAEADALLSAKKDSGAQDQPAPTLPPATDHIAKAHTLIINAELRAAAAQAGFYDPGDAVALAGAYRDEITVDDDGVVDGVAEAVAALAKAKPHLLKPKNAPPPAGGVHGGDKGVPKVNPGEEFAQRRLERSKRVAAGAKQWTE